MQAGGVRVSSRDDVRADRVVGSMLWSAWADALGFISELTDEAGLRRRLGGQDFVEPVAWSRRVGGQYGATVLLPAGCYSDDTQLRLATARAISPRGFDVEAFAAVELTVWPSYALGGGRASKAAAANFTKPNVTWFANFFDGWTKAGGNGAAMRIQPHVWAAHQGELAGTLRGILTNAVTTHGHPRALVGAVVYGAALIQAIDGRPPTRAVWRDLLEITGHGAALFDGIDPLPWTWIPAWEEAEGRSFESAWAEAFSEMQDQLAVAAKAVKALRAASMDERDGVYRKLVAALRLAEPSNRGSGISTVAAALAIAAAFPEDPAGGALLASRALGTDTDTIATMAAALVGAVAVDVPYPKPLQDDDYLTAQALRLADISSGKVVDSTSYPDLLTWAPPRSQIDAVGLDEGRPALAGLGYLTPTLDSEVYSSRGSLWQWMVSDFGATFLLKHRAQLRELPAGARPVRREHDSGRIYDASPTTIPREQVELVQTLPMNVDLPALEMVVHGPTEEAPRAEHGETRRRRSTPANVDVDQMLAWVKQQGLTENAIGYAVARIAELGSVEQLIGFTSSLRTMLRKKSNERPK
jgi:ADP-ribosylglycohydrolase